TTKPLLTGGKNDSVRRPLVWLSGRSHAHRPRRQVEDGYPRSDQRGGFPLRDAAPVDPRAVGPRVDAAFAGARTSGARNANGAEARPAVGDRVSAVAAR